MKNTFKKIGALVLVLVMMLAMSATAFAEGETEADMTGEAGVIGEFIPADTITLYEKSVTIYKEITAYNPETCKVNAPAVTFNYTITAGGAGYTITDASNMHDPAASVRAKTKAGVGTPTITGTAAGELELVPGRDGDKLDASEYGTANRFPLEVSFANVNFNTEGSGAGVYRYVIKETTEVGTKNASGIDEGTVANTLYMDVYVDGDGAIYGYVLFTENDDIDASTSAAAAATAANKIEGFVGSEEDGGTYTSDNVSIADKYYTFNLDVKKVVENDAYAVSTKHKFPFTITLTNASVTAHVLPIMTINDNSLASQDPLSAASIAGTWSPKIADGGVISYVGIPCGTTVVIKETNDVTGVTYNSVSTNADTDAAATAIFTDEVSNEAIVDCGATALAAATKNHTVGGAGIVIFTNTLLQISPTGIVMRVAPYALILAAGVVLLVLSRKRRNRDEA